MPPQLLSALHDHVMSLTVPRYTIILFSYLLKHNRVIAHDEIHESYSGKNILCKDPKLSDRSTEQTVQTDVSLLLKKGSD